MPGFLLHLGATVLCAHGGQATPSAPNPRVLLSGQPATTLGAPYMIAGCAMPPLRHRPLADGRDAGADRRPAGAASGIPVNLRPDGYADDGRRRANSCNGDVK